MDRESERLESCRKRMAPIITPMNTCRIVVGPLLALLWKKRSSCCQAFPRSHDYTEKTGTFELARIRRPSIPPRIGAPLLERRNHVGNRCQATAPMYKAAHSRPAAERDSARKPALLGGPHSCPVLAVPQCVVGAHRNPYNKGVRNFQTLETVCHVHTPFLFVWSALSYPVEHFRAQN